MALLKFNNRGGYLAFDEGDCRGAGQSLAERYAAAAPFPHIAIDDFLPVDVLRAVITDFPARGNHVVFDRQQERLKYQFHPQDCQGLAVRNMFAELNSQAFLTFLEELTGIQGLIADPYFFGAGLHETLPGGHLGIHADFNRHRKMNLVRRLNLLIYLNDDWDESYNGALELWDRTMTKCVERVMPLLNRAVIFNTDFDSYHGHPDPLACPAGLSRRSIATYYYTAPAAETPEVDRDTRFRVRPGSADRREWRTILHHLASDWTPALQPGRRRAMFRL